jgi:hypothetical protein
VKVAPTRELGCLGIGPVTTGSEREVDFLQKWEYATVPLISHALQEILNQWGEEGWELVQVIESQATGTTAFLKRLKPEETRQSS